MTTPVNFHQIRPVDGSRRTGFEKFCGQIARHYCKNQFDKNLQIRDDPDAGLEYFVEVEGDLIGWQAKYFETPPSAQQLSQFKDSFSRAVDNHNKLTKFIACCPFDRASDPSSDSQFLEDRWNDFEEWASEYLEGKSQDVSIEYWGRSELEDFLSEDELRGHQYYWFNNEGLTFRKLNNLAEERVANARIDHSKQSVKLPVERAFELLGRTPKGEQIMADIVNDIQEITFPWEYPIEVGESDASWDSVPENYRDLAIEEKFQETVDRLNRSYDVDDEIPITTCRESISEIKQKVASVIEEIPPKKDDAPSDQSEVYSKISKYYRRFLNDINSIANNLEDPIFDLLNQPTLAIWGDAGVGKTHIFCDITKRRLESERPTILYLGEQFRKGNIQSQLVEFTDFDVDNFNELLGALDAMGQVEETRALIQIDGINETKDREIWQQQLRGLIKKIQRYEYVGLSVSYRTEYRDQIEPTGSISDYITYVEHTGFSGYETQAVEVFFNEYGITEPNHPVLRPEFSKPLFLELYCKVLSNKPGRFNDVRVLDISTLFEGYIRSINDRLAAPQRLDYSKYENKVQNAVLSLAESMIKTDQKVLPYNEAKTSINSQLPHRTRASEQLFTGLLNEDLIEVVPSSSQQDHKKVRFSYERLADHFITQKLIQKHYTGPDSFESGTELHRQLTTVTGLGKLEINFAIQLPETVDEESVPHKASSANCF